MIARTAALAALAAGVAHAAPSTTKHSHTHVNAAALNRTNWEAEAQIKDATTECSAYDYPPVTALLKNYPTVWQQPAALSFAGLLPSDQAAYDAIKGSIPNIAPRGTINGDWTGVKYDINADPDCWWTDTGCTTPKLAGVPADVTTCPEANTWGFTLDDGPNCSHNAYFDYLQSIEQKATLFYIGSNLADWPLEGQRGLADGHEICAHTWSHPYMTSLTNEQAFAELYFSKKLIHDVLGVTVTCWRPPYGDVDDRIRFIANELGMKTIIWDHDTFDWEWTQTGVKTVEDNYNKLLNTSFDTHGTIVLSHEIDGETMALSEQFLPAIRKKFTGGVMPVGVCQNWTQPYGEGAAYQYPNYAQWAAGTRSIQLALPTAATTELPFATAAVVTSTGLGGAAAATTAASSAATSSAAASSATTTAKSSSAAGSGSKTALNAQTSAAQSSAAAASANNNTSGARGLSASVPAMAGAALVAVAGAMVVLA